MNLRHVYSFKKFLGVTERAILIVLKHMIQKILHNTHPKTEFLV